MADEPQRQGSRNGYPGERQSLRLRRVSSDESHQNYPQFNWSSKPAEDDEQNSGPARDLRSIPLHMALRRAVRQVQQMQVPVVSSLHPWNWTKSKSVRKLKDSARGFLQFFVLWRKTLQKIGGNYGGGVQSYFLFLRFLVLLNFFSFLLIAGFVIIPSIVFRSVGTSLFNSTGPQECMNYDPNPQGLVVFYNYFLDLLSGTGFMEYSYMFYGYYNNTMVADMNFSYNIPLAYLLTAAFYFAFCLISIIIRMGTAARVAVATGGSTVGNYSMIVFTGWDYGCLGDQATKLKQKNMLYRLQVDLEEESRKKQAAALSLSQKVVLYSLRIFMGLVAFGLIIGAFYGIFEATNFSQQRSGEEGIEGLFFEYLPSIVITIGNFVVPLLCDQIALVERYSPSTTIIVALLRAVFLRLVSLGALLFTLWGQITCEGDTESPPCKLCQYNEVYPCWETRVGQEMYKLTLFDLLISITLLIFVEFPRRMVVDNWSCKLAQWLGRQEFVVPSNVLGLVYGQTVVWMGALFCPLLPLINTIKFVILFYCKKVTLFHNCRPAVRTFRSTTSTIYFLVVLLFGWGLATVVMIYSLAEIRPSMGCGPFRFFPNMWSVVPTSFYSLSKTTQEFLFFIGSQAFSIPLFVLSCVVMCYFIALASVYGRNVALLKAQLKLEGYDKKFLVKQIQEVSKKLQIPRRNSRLQD
ncbi:transmembrane channel-like protein 7 [Echeneis naucrates]|uniref:transmembrane channel-like protein 7 n=1 Tax=Echeneis naucrates TaxID=173247 RepID=UPI0011145F18|nr:transmembrane channel-like protein 4 [Echeneis naucrates]